MGRLAAVGNLVRVMQSLALGPQVAFLEAADPAANRQGRTSQIRPRIIKPQRWPKNNRRRREGPVIFPFFFAGRTTAKASSCGGRQPCTGIRATPDPDPQVAFLSAGPAASRQGSLPDQFNEQNSAPRVMQLCNVSFRQPVRART